MLAIIFVMYVLVCLGISEIIRDLENDQVIMGYGPELLLEMKEEIEASFGELPRDFGKHWETVRFELDDSLDVELSSEGGAYLSTSFRTQKISARPSALIQFISRLKTSAMEICFTEFSKQESFNWDMVFSLPDELLPSAQLRHEMSDSTQALLLGKGDKITGIIPEPVIFAPINIELPSDLMPQPIDTTGPSYQRWMSSNQPAETTSSY